MLSRRQAGEHARWFLAKRYVKFDLGRFEQVCLSGRCRNASAREQLPLALAACFQNGSSKPDRFAVSSHQAMIYGSILLRNRYANRSARVLAGFRGNERFIWLG